ncbi:MAG: helix-turn-helix transcriptional regulator [Candidatus Diapherotrites archaeon]|nr:helix-turn-helix transcriptional regulator [Candidatus Diapherotrites archaeon]
MEQLIAEIRDIRKKMVKNAPPEMKKVMLNKYVSTIFRIRLLALALLSKKETYGYEIINLAKGISIEEEPRISASKVYPVLHEMENKGLIKGRWHGRKKIYSITKKGLKMMNWIKRSWKESIILQAKVFKKIFNEEVKT